MNVKFLNITAKGTIMVKELEIESNKKLFPCDLAVKVGKQLKINFNAIKIRSNDNTDQTQ